ncbi:hypothetical protein QQF64_033981 [Cirrhinus molitorella]|uniref:small monomeric GTPase n=1 Tax=Cirrhinus molitorella TaxID=172907 RepID=A0ABR3MVF5_9TELE
MWDSTQKGVIPTNGCSSEITLRHSSKTWKATSRKWSQRSLLGILTVRFLTSGFIGGIGDINVEESGYISDRQLQWADGYILVYSICDRASFNMVRQQVQCIRQAKQKLASTAQIIIVGNKRDLQHRRTVSSEEGRLLALSADCGFFEVSAAETYHGVLMVFHELFELIREARALKKGTAGFKGIVRSMVAVFGRKRLSSFMFPPQKRWKNQG